jgi:hypothetical protein
MRRKYYIHYWRNFENTFELYYADTPEEAAKLEEVEEVYRLTRKQAEQKARNEMWAREHDAAFSGYGAVYVLPARVFFNRDNDFIFNPQEEICRGRFYLSGRVLEEITKNA